MHNTKPVASLGNAPFGSDGVSEVKLGMEAIINGGKWLSQIIKKEQQKMKSMEFEAFVYLIWTDVNPFAPDYDLPEISFMNWYR